MGITSSQIKDVERILDYQFKDVNLLKQALTHVSMGNRYASYERMEFFGDRILGFLVAELLYDEFPKNLDNCLSKFYNNLVCGRMLAKICRDLRLNQYIILSSSERRSQGAQKPSIQADIIEALIAAIYLDGGIDSARKFIRRVWQKYLDSGQAVAQNYKSLLQEHVQALGFNYPVYEIIDKKGPCHNPEITVMVRVEEQQVSAKGVGNSRRAAEAQAAQKLYNQLTKKESSENG